MNASAYPLRMDMRRGYRFPMNRAAFMGEGAISRRWTRSQVDGYLSVRGLNRKPFIGFDKNANIGVHVGIHEKWLEIGGPGPNSRGLY